MALSVKSWASSWFKGVIIASLVLASIFLFSSTNVSAQGSSVRAVICDTTGPSLVISQPVSDTVTSQLETVITGTTERTTQIDIYINNVYSHSVALAINDPLYIPVRLQRGTNTIRLEAFFSCNHTNQSYNLVVSYEPGAVPGAASTSLADSKRAASSNSGSGDSILERIKDNLNLTDKKTYPSSFVVPLGNWLLLLVGLLAIAMMLVPSSWINLIDKLFHRTSEKRSRHLRRIIRIFGAALLVICLLLLQR